VDLPAGEVPASQLLEIAELARPVQAAPRALRIAQQIEVMTHEVDHAIAHEAFEDFGADFVVIAFAEESTSFGRDGFSHIVEQRRGQELAVVGLAARVLEDLKRVEESVALRMIADRLGHAIEGVQKLEQLGQFIVHSP